MKTYAFKAELEFKAEDDERALERLQKHFAGARLRGHFNDRSTLVVYEPNASLDLVSYLTIKEVKEGG